MAVLNRTDVDPDSVAKDQRYGEDFKVEVYFKNLCKKCTRSDRPIEELCGQCKEHMKEDINESWKVIHSILRVRDRFLIKKVI